MKPMLKALVVSTFALFAFGLVQPVEAQHEFVGSKKCRKCHTKEYRSWRKTAMAKSFEVLEPGKRADEKKAAGLDPNKDYTKDPDCVRCHVTGYGKPGGFVDIESTPDLAGVGCEACHGAASTYLQDGYMTADNEDYKKSDLVAAGMIGTITKEVCTVCHNADSPFVGKDFVFDFEANKDKGIHKIYRLKHKH